MKIAIGSDHAALDLKQEIIAHFKEKGIEYADVGVYTKESADYPDMAEKVAELVLTKACDKGVLICGTGIGISIAANKIPGIRCALCHESVSARLTREHNDANIVAMGARIIGVEVAKDIVDVFLGTDFSGDARHQRRIDKITGIEGKYVK